MPTWFSRFLRTTVAIFLMAPLLCTGADACGLLLRITYAEDYPDWFHVEFLEGAGFELTGLQLDLTGAAGEPFIDIAYPNSRHSGKDGIVVTDAAGFDTGSRAMAFKFAHFAVGKTYRLLVDLDGRADQLDNGELHGAGVVARFLNVDGTLQKLEGQFDSDGVAELGSHACA